MKKIILPTDFSKNAFNAICYAAELFKKEECVFYLVNTYT
ncbi:MAG: universal stress protein, partial [Eudoraea sp.]